MKEGILALGNVSKARRLHSIHFKMVCFQDFVQRLSRRMTRFCVNVGLAQIVPRITDAAQSCGYIVKEKITTQVSVFEN